MANNKKKSIKLVQVLSRLNKLEIELSDEQIDFILHPVLNSCYLKACPGSGKTEVVGIKAAYEISEWQDRFSGLAVLSFTKNAAKEISERVKKYGGINAAKHPHFIGTIDSWLHSYILHPFAHKSIKYKGQNGDKSIRIVDNEEQYDFLTHFKTVLNPPPKYSEAWVNQYYFECGTPPTLQSQSKYLDFSSISSILLKTLGKNKKRFLEAGLATYSDSEFLCYYFLLKNPNILKLIIKRFPIVFIDECQDLSHNQLEILKLLKNGGIIVHFIGDNNQSIYEFKKVYVEKINLFIKNNNLIEKQLTKNFRSNQTIVNITMGLEKHNTGLKAQDVVGNENHIITDCCILWEYKKNEINQIPQNFINLIGKINSTRDDRKIRVENSAILARGHSILSTFKNSPISSLSKVELFANALSCWNNNQRTGKDMQNALQQLGKSICLFGFNGNGNHQHQYCPEHYTPMDWRNTLFNLLENATNPQNNLYPLSQLTWKEWCANLKVFLENYWDNLHPSRTDWTDVKSKIKSPNKSATKIVIDTIKSIQSSYSEKIRMTTFHDVKGETLDAVLVMSSPDKKSKGGHFEHWINSDQQDKEFVRFAYVASSRPKHLLIWAIPKITNNQHLQTIKDLGFTLTNIS